MKKSLFLLFCLFLYVANVSTQTLTQTVKSSFVPFEVGENHPQGWLLDYARTAARGLTRTLSDKYWPFSTGWADATMDGWWPYEQAGYYADGLVRLAYVINDTVLKQKAEKIMKTVVARQQPDGYIYSNNDKFRKDWNTEDEDFGVYWSQAVFGRAAIAYYSATGDKSVLEMLRKCYKGMPIFKRHITQYPFSGTEMTEMRKLVGVEVMTEAARYASDSELAQHAVDELCPFEDAAFASWVKNKDFYRTAICHGVTYNEVAKLFAVVYPWNGDADYLKASQGAFDFLEKNYVLPNGVNSSNEYLRGRGAFEGAETCDISDYMWSNIWLARASGNAHYGDNIEKVFFNAFPAVLSPDFTLSQYETAPNRIPGLHLRYRDDGNWFKELHWPTCCTGNLNRVIPNYIINMFMKNGQHQLMVLTYGPAHLQSRDGSYDIEMNTQYPFRNKIELTVNAIPAGEQLMLRVPEWCTEAPQLTINGKTYRYNLGDKHFITLIRKWKKGDRITLTLPMKVVVNEGVENYALYKGEETYWGSGHPEGAQYAIDGFCEGARYATVNYGALLFALPLYDKTDWGFDLNEGGWQNFGYALSTDAARDAEVEFSDLHQPFYWSCDWAPIEIKLTAGLIKWNIDKGNPRLPEMLTAPSATQRITLIPYGCARYRLTMFPNFAR